MAAPTASNPGSNVNNLGAAAAALPAAAPVVGNLAVLVCVHRDTAVGTPTPSDTAGFGPWSQIGSTVVQGAAQLTVWTAVVESTTPTAPTVSDSGDHTQTRLFYLNHASGTPEVHATATSTDATSDTSGNATSPTTTVADCLVMLFGAGDTPDSIGTAEYTTPANTSLTSIIEVADNSVSTGGGGSKIIAKGIKAAAGAVADWTYTKTTAGVKAHRVVAFSPPQPPAKSGSSSVRGGGTVTTVGVGPPSTEPTFDATLGTATNAGSLVTSAAAAAGSRIFLFVWHYDAQLNECTGATGGGLTWVKDHGTAILSDGGSRLTILSADAPAGLASGTTITPTFSLGAVDFGPGMAAHSWLGVKDGASGYLDATSTTKQDFAEAWTTNNLVTSDAKSLLFGFSLGGASGQSHSPATNYDERHDWTAEGANRCAVVSRVANAGTYTPGGTWAVSVDQQANIGVAYQAAPADTGATGTSAVRGGGAAASSGTKAAAGASSVRGGGQAAGAVRKAAAGSSSVRGGGQVVTAGSRGAETHSGASSVRGGGSAASQVRKGALAASTVRGGGAAFSTTSAGAQAASTVRGGGTVTGTGRKAAAASSSVRGGGQVVSVGAGVPARTGSSSVRGGGQVVTLTRKTATSSSTVRGGGTVVTTGAQVPTKFGTSSVRGGGTVTGTASAGRSASSQVRGGGSAASTARKTATSSSTVRGGGTVTGAVRKAAAGASTVRGGGLVVSVGTQQIAKTGSSSVRGGGLVAGVGRKATSSSSTVRGGGTVAGTVRKASSATSQVRGGGFVVSAGSQQIAKTGASSVRGGGRPTSTGLKAAARSSSVRGGGLVRCTARKATVAVSAIVGGGFVTTTTRRAAASSSTVRGGGYVTSTTVSGQAAAPPITWRTGNGPGSSGRTASTGGNGRTAADDGKTGRTTTSADAGVTLAGVHAGRVTTILSTGGDE